MSCVRTGGIGFLSDTQRLNVALTRARCSLLLCGNFTSLQVSAYYILLCYMAQWWICVIWCQSGVAAELLKVQVFLDVVPCCWVCSSWHFEQSWCLHHSVFLTCSTLKVKALQSCELSGNTHPLTQNHVPGDFISTVKNFVVHICVAAGKNVCTFQLINALSDRNLPGMHCTRVKKEKN